MTTQHAVFEKFLTEDEERRLMKAVASASGWQAQRDWALLTLMRSTGVRVGTLVKLTVGDAREALSEGRITFRSEISKRGTGYWVTLTDKARKALQVLLRIRGDLGLGRPLDGRLVVSRQHNGEDLGMTVRAVQLRVRHWTQQAGLDVSVTPHWLRHTYGQRIVRNSTAQNPLLIANKALGHRSLNSTLVYTRPTREDLKLALQESGA